MPHGKLEARMTKPDFSCLLRILVEHAVDFLVVGGVGAGPSGRLSEHVRFGHRAFHGAGQHHAPACRFGGLGRLLSSTTRETDPGTRFESGDPDRREGGNRSRKGSGRSAAPTPRTRRIAPETGRGIKKKPDLAIGLL